LTAKERRELPAKAFGIPSQRKYPVMIIGRDGKPKYSLSHARDAKGRAKQELDKGVINKRQYDQIIRKANLAERSAKKSGPKRRNPPPMMNPSMEDRGRVGEDALQKSEMYWSKYEADPRKTNFLVDSYKFLVIAHEELKYADDPGVRLAADHALKRAHAELTRRLKD
jgi:hypothetical protein